MEIRHLQHFVALAEQKNFTTAARSVHIVQSGLSTSIRELEDELGVKLFSRTTRQVSLTEAGSIFLHHAKNSLVSFDSARRSVQDSSRELDGLLRIGMLPCTSPYVPIANLLRCFKTIFPRIKVDLCTLANDDIFEAIRTEQLDIAFFSMLDHLRGSDLDIIPYADDHLVALCSTSHTLAGNPSATLQELAQYPFVDPGKNRSLRQIIDLQFRRADLRRNSEYEVSEPSAGIDLVEQGLGVGILQGNSRNT